MKNSNTEFIIDKHGIGWIDSDFKSRFGNVDFKERSLGSFNVLPRSMNGDTMIAEGLAKECELGDVLALLQNPPEGTKDGYANIFVLKSFVVDVSWYSDGSRRRVGAWRRDEDAWDAGGRVFSPATVSGSLTLEPSDPIALEIRNLAEQVKRIADYLEPKNGLPQQKTKKIVKKRKK